MNYPLHHAVANGNIDKIKNPLDSMINVDFDRKSVQHNEYTLYI